MEDNLVLFLLKERESTCEQEPQEGRRISIAQQQLKWASNSFNDIAAASLTDFLNNLCSGLLTTEFSSPPSPAVSLYFRLPPKNLRQSPGDPGLQGESKNFQVLASSILPEATTHRPCTSRNRLLGDGSGISLKG